MLNNDNATPPSSLLLATDLGARCDRALERAIQLARQWRARLVVACVLPPAARQELYEELFGQPDWTRSVDPASYARRQLERELGAQAAGVEVSLRLEEGDVGPTVARVAQEEGCGLVVTGLACDALFEQPRLGSTVTWLARNSALPLLLVRHRAHAQYRAMALACDFSPACSSALAAALSLFGEPIQLSLVHGLHITRAGLRDTPRDELETTAANRIRAQARHFLADARWSPELSQRAQVVIEPGEPARVVGRYARDHDTDLVVVGSHGRSTLSELLLGSNAQRLVGSAVTDTLLVRSPPAAPGT